MNRTWNIRTVLVPEIPNEWIPTIAIQYEYE